MAAIKQQKQMEYLNSSLEAVRTLPDVYIGALGDKGVKNMYREIVQNYIQ